MSSPGSPSQRGRARGLAFMAALSAPLIVIASTVLIVKQVRGAGNAVGSQRFDATAGRMLSCHGSSSITPSPMRVLTRQVSRLLSGARSPPPQRCIRTSLTRSFSVARRSATRIGISQALIHGFVGSSRPVQPCVNCPTRTTPSRSEHAPRARPAALRHLRQARRPLSWSCSHLAGAADRRQRYERRMQRPAASVACGRGRTRRE